VEAEYTRQFVRNIMSKFEILQSNKIEREIRNLNDKLHQTLVLEKKKHLFEHIVYNIGSVASNIIRGMLILFVGTRIFQGTANYSDLILAITVIGYFEKSMQDITTIYKKILKNFSYVSKLWEFIDESPKIKNTDTGKDFTYANGTIEIRNVSFGYHENAGVFSGLSHVIAGGTKTAFVGESGGGKTTLVKLLSGYISPNQGEILIDGQKLSEMKLSDYYRHVGYLTQDPSVFDGTIYENLAYALETAPTEDELHRVIRSAKCEFVLEFEK
jgi:ABC-type multidrug transport system fused ATPase/permease subunit